MSPTRPDKHVCINISSLVDRFINSWWKFVGGLPPIDPVRLSIYSCSAVFDHCSRATLVRTPSPVLDNFDERNPRHSAIQMLEPYRLVHGLGDVHLFNHR
jgi:hypothetical protein